MDRVVLLGVPVDPVTMPEAIARLCAMLAEPGQHHVMTPNNEMLVEAQSNEPFRSLLNRTSLNLPDSTGLLWAARWTEQHLPKRVSGVDTVKAFCTKLDEGSTLFLLGGAEGIAGRAGAALCAANPHLRVAGTFAGSPREEEAKDIITRINASGAKVLLVAYGSPAQDLWIDSHLKEMPSVKVAMGVGGTFDFLAGTKKRAPMWMQSSGLEWLYRFVQEPSRYKRMWNAVVVFPLMVITQPALSSSKGAAAPQR